MTKLVAVPPKGGKGIGKQFVAYEKPKRAFKQKTLRRLLTLEHPDLRLAKSVYPAAERLMEEFMERVVTHAILYANSAGRVTLYVSDIKRGLRMEVRANTKLGQLNAALPTQNRRA